MAKVILEIVADPSKLEPLENKVEELNKGFSNVTKTAQTTGKTIADNSKAAYVPLEKMSKSIQDLNKNLISGALKQGAKELQEVAKVSADTATKTTSLRTQIKELVAEMGRLAVAGKEDTAQYRELQKEAARLKEIQDDLALSVNRLANNKLEVALNGIVAASRLAAAGFGVAASTAAIFGSENEELQRTMIKLQAAMTLVNSLQEIQQLLRKEDALNTARQVFFGTAHTATVTAETAATTANTVATEANTVAKNASLLATMALTTVGIGALILGIGALTSYLISGGDETDNYSDSIDNLGESVDGLTQKTKTATDEMSLFWAELDKATLSVAGTSEKINKQIEANEFWLNSFDNINKKLQENIDLMRDRFFLANGGINDMEREIKVLEAKGNKESQIIALERRIANERLSFLAREISLNETIINKLPENSKKRQDAEIALLKLYDQKDEIITNLQVKEINYYNELAKKFKENNALFREGLDQIVAAGTTFDELRKQLEKEPLTIQAAIEVDPANVDKITKGLTQVQQAVLDASVQFAQQAFAAIFDVQAQYRQQSYDADISKLQNQKDAELANKELTEAQKQAIDIKYQIKERQLRQQQFIREKQAKTAAATVNAALAITEYIAKNAPFISGIPNPTFPIGLGLLAATSAIQIAAIQATPIPQFYKGGYTGEGGKYEAAGTVHKGEFVIPSETVAKFGLKDMTVPQFDKMLAGLTVPKLLLPNEKTATATPIFNIDYDVLAEKIGAEFGKHKQVVINVDKDGFTTFVKGTNNVTQYWNNKFSR